MLQIVIVDYQAMIIVALPLIVAVSNPVQVKIGLWSKLRKSLIDPKAPGVRAAPTAISTGR